MRAFSKLTGAVPDADAIERYLTIDLGVAEQHIRSLRDKDATRSRVIQELQAMAHDPRIEVGDPIVFYYAGHGSTVQSPHDWGNTDIQLILPYDYSCEVDGVTVNGIPDRTIGALLAKLAEAKGNNITVVFDYCHSGSASCDDGLIPLRRARGIPSSLPIPADLDRDILSSSSSTHRMSDVLPGFLNQCLNSHVLLAACGMDELAWEEQGRGCFTRALLETLSSRGFDPRSLTYADLITRLPKLAG
ncbi:hypothetical protein PHLCEN_2v11482 [Hermanssonia centrifuga]|uniref:Peptidase C14 caspase domain-containing protein n=1 Tax=Hermanssonia centrifuga TaxID=98765 RepID=A0A2R6NJV8_9APHY|nr:hypothetical protein PHLCEN_2v11482 [Hermanssonia centrifuga]